MWFPQLQPIGTQPSKASKRSGQKWPPPLEPSDGGGVQPVFRDLARLSVRLLMEGYPLPMSIRQARLFKPSGNIMS